MLRYDTFKLPKASFAAGVLQGLALGHELQVVESERMGDAYDDLITEEPICHFGFLPRRGPSTILLVDKSTTPMPHNVVGIFMVRPDGEFYGSTTVGGNHDLNATEFASLLRRAMEDRRR